MSVFNEFKHFGTALSAKQKIAAGGIIAAVLILIISLCVRGCSSSSGNRERQNMISLVRMYMDKGEYDRAMDKLDELLIRNPNDKDALSLMDKVIEAKENGGNTQNTNVKVEVDTQELTDVVQSSIESMKTELAKTSEAAEENRRAMTDLLKKQQEQAEIEKSRREEQLLQQKAAEEQRKKEETARKAAEEALARKNEQLRKEIAAVNDEIQQGRTALNSGNVNSAFEHFSKAEKNLPVSDGEPSFSGSKYSEMASLLYDAVQGAATDSDRSRLRSTAVTYAESSVAKDPKNAAPHYILGMNALDNKNYRESLDELTKAVSYDNQNSMYYYNLGRVQYMMKKYTEAKASFNTAAQLNGGFAQARYNLALTNLKLNDQKSALVELRRAHDIDPRYEKAYLEEARLLSRSGDYAGSISAYQNVIKINSVNRAALQELGSVYYQVKKLPEAEDSFRKSIALLPSGTSDPLTFYNLSTVLYEENKVDEAVAYAKRAYDSKDLLKDSNSRANIVYNYALICDQTGKVDEAIAKYAEVLQIKPDHLKTEINLGVMYMNMNPPDTDTALSFFQKAYSQDKNNFEANNNLGSAYLQKKDYSNAVLYFQNALKIDPKNKTVRSNLAQTFAGDGQYDNAKTTYLEIIKQDNTEWDAYVELGKVCMALKDSESAEKYLVYVQAKNPSYRKNEVDRLLASIQGGGIL